jgi:hypothetical protein
MHCLKPSSMPSSQTTTTRPENASPSKPQPKSSSRCTSNVNPQGSRRLDDEACGMVLQRGRFHPAKNAEGVPETGVYRGGLTWKIEG